MNDDTKAVEVSLADRTKYVHARLSRKDSEHAGFDDVRATAMAVLQVQQDGLDNWLGASLSFSHLAKTSEFRAVVERGLSELASFLQSQRVT